MTLYIKAVDSSVSALSLHNQVKNLNEQRELSKLCELKNEVGTLAPADEKRYRSLRRQDYGLLIWKFSIFCDTDEDSNINEIWLYWLGF